MKRRSVIGSISGPILRYWLLRSAFHELIFHFIPQNKQFSCSEENLYIHVFRAIRVKCSQKLRGKSKYMPFFFRARVYREWIAEMHHFRAHVLIDRQSLTNVFQSFTRSSYFKYEFKRSSHFKSWWVYEPEKVGQKLAWIAKSSICCQQFSNMFAYCFCTLQKH